MRIRQLAEGLLFVALLLSSIAHAQTTTGSGTTSAGGSTTGGTTSGCTPLTCATVTPGACGEVPDSCGELLNCPCDAGGPQCGADQPVPCTTSDGQFCCARSQPYCCPGFTCSSDPTCGGAATTTSTGATTSSSTSGPSSSSGTTGSTTSTAGTTGGSGTTTGSSTSSGTTNGSVSQTECPQDQPFACGGGLCCTADAPSCCESDDGGLFCSADPNCGEVFHSGHIVNRYGCDCGTSSAGSLFSSLLALTGLVMLRRKRPVR